MLVGPSGCGKSTVLRLLAGLESVERGHITIGDQDVTHLPPRARDVAMVFQNYALYPNMTVAANMGFALRNAGASRAETRQRVLEVATMLELTELLDRKPSKLSGGQRQRWRWDVRSCGGPGCSAWMSRCRIWMPSCG